MLRQPFNWNCVDRLAAMALHAVSMCTCIYVELSYRARYVPNVEYIGENDS